MKKPEKKIVLDYKKEVIEKALRRFKELVNFLDCECDNYNGFTCSIHQDRDLADLACNNWEAYIKENYIKKDKLPSVAELVGILDAHRHCSISMQVRKVLDRIRSER